MTIQSKTAEDKLTFSLKWSDLLIGVLALLTFMGVIAGAGRMIAGLRASTALTDHYAWGIWIGFDFTLIAFAGTGFTMAAITHILHRDKYIPVLRPAILAGLLGYGTVLLLLVLDLGRPDRFYNFILFWNIHSPLFEISWCVLLYTTVLTIETSPYILKWLNQEWLLGLVGKAMTVVAIAGVTLSSLHQSTLGTLYLNMPHRLNQLWYTPILPFLFFVSSVMAGLGLAIVAYRLAVRVQGEAEDQGIVRGLSKGLIGVTLFYLLLKVGEMAVAGELGALFALDQPSLLMLSTELGLGVALPLLLWAIPSIRNHSLNQWIIPLLVLFGVLMNRFNATMFAQQLPPGTTYSPHILEWISTIGFLAGAALVWYLGVRFLPTPEHNH